MDYSELECPLANYFMHLTKYKCLSDVGCWRKIVTKMHKSFKLSKEFRTKDTANRGDKPVSSFGAARFSK